MKRIFKFLVLISLIVVAFGTAVLADSSVGVAGYVLHTDIRVTIDGVPIMGYNIDGNTYVVAEDLVYYGIDVAWDGATGVLTINTSNGVFAGNVPIVPQNIQPSGTVAFSYYHTNILTYINGRLVQSFNIDGRTVISIDELVLRLGSDLVWHPDQSLLAAVIWGDTARDEIFSTELFNLVNIFRAENGLATLIWHDGLTNVAVLHLNDIEQNNLTIGNTGSGGENMAQRITRLGYNVALPNGFTATANQATPQAMFDWIISNNNRRNILLNEQADFIGFARAGHTLSSGAATYRINLMVGAEPISNDQHTFEQAIFAMLNIVRVQNGLQPLRWDAELAQNIRTRAENGNVLGTSANLRIEQTRGIRFNDTTPEFIWERIIENDRLLGFALNPDAVAVGIGYAEVWRLFNTEEYTAALGIYFINNAGQVSDNINPFLVANMIEVGQLPQSSITINIARQATSQERNAWIAEYWSLGGANAFEREVARLVSEYRVSLGLSPVVFDETLAMSARYYTQMLITLGYHTSTSPGTAHAQGPYGTSVATARSFGANITWGGNAFTPGPQTPQAVVQGWINSPGHNRYLISPEHRYIGSGISLSSEGRPWHYLFLSANPSRS
ncbi:MAG: CAP domain-containing protein [Defluviitaleaceae bacterium]|nr:CAP domain-containing protein [Defluviitaleaceae bacterium]